VSSHRLKITNRLLQRFGVLLVPCPPSAKMLREHANVSETHHPSRGGRTVAWMRHVAELAEAQQEADRHA
jgi:hypothetical protein